MRNRWFVVVVSAVAMFAARSASAQGLIVRDNLGAAHLNALCSVLGCNVARGLGDPQQAAFLVTPTSVSLGSLLQVLPLQLGIVDVEVDQLVSLLTPPLTHIPQSLFDNSPVSYYGATVWDGYVNQPANIIVRTLATQEQFRVSGSGIVAIIDTGLDPQHPALAPVALSGYDFTRNITGADEKGDLDHSTAAVLDGGANAIPLYVTPGLAAVLPPAAAAALGAPQYAAFGHGTMTAGIVHMVAPTAQILPLKAFSSDGTGYLSNVIRAVYYAANHHSAVISMSFNFYNYSTELANAINYVSYRGLICVAAAGNDGERIQVYPASLANVMGVASTSDFDMRSNFSNYGAQVVWLAAPGEDIVSTYPYGTYSSSSGTSFSTPFISGTASLLLNIVGNTNESTASAAISHAKYISSDLNHGRLDTYLAAGAMSTGH